MYVIEAETYPDAWRQAVISINNNGGISYGLVVRINRPLDTCVADNEVIERVDKFLAEHEKQPLNTVATTIFPMHQYNPNDKDTTGVYETYPREEYPRTRKRGDRNWGRYAYRLVRRLDENKNEMIAPKGTVDEGVVVNPLKR
ncbi:MAG: hypothetical protein HQ513_10130 [Rhodospirillales bacterium]|nr:hypothetical protein [Rhodospirillales bacterium]